MDSLRRFWQFHNSDPEVASADVSNVLAPVRFKILGPNSDFHHSIQIAQIGDIHVWHSISSTGFVLKKQPVRKSIFELHFLEEGNCSTIANNQSVEAGPGDVLLLREPNKHDLVCQPDTVQLCIVIPLERYSEVMAAEFGDPFADLSAMRPGATCQKASIQSLKQIVELMLSLRRNDPAPEKASIGAPYYLRVFSRSSAKVGQGLLPIGTTSLPGHSTSRRPWNGCSFMQQKNQA